MERTLFARLWRRLGARYLALYFVFDLLSGWAVAAGTIGLLSLYESMSLGEYLVIVGVACGAIAVGVTAGWYAGRPALRPLAAWLRGERDPERAPEAWRAAVGVPVEFVTRAQWLPVVAVLIPVVAFITAYLGVPWYAGIILFAGGVVSVAYSAVLHFFATEVALRPVVRDIAEHLPPAFSGAGVGTSLRVKLLASLPLINVITAVVVSGLSAGEGASLADLGWDVAIALLVSFTLSFELTVLVAKSILLPLRDLLESTERVRHGDLSARVPVMSGDELGGLAQSFNQMMSGLQEREALREAFGSYVDPGVAERVLAEGQTLEGEDVELTVMFVDMCNFTSFAERASARETVARLNEFFGLIVPILARHGGHANKFIGDGVMGVFGAPERLADHASRAVAAACEIADAVEERYGGDLKIGVGINSGLASVGSIGGGGRLEFAVIGDTVNVASRVEHLTRELGDTVLLTEATRALLNGADVALEPRGEVPIRGRADTVPVYAPATAAHPSPMARR